MRTRQAQRTNVTAMLFSVKQDWFDLSYITDGHLVVKCSQCEALVINGVPTHEAGCPNELKARRAQQENGNG